MSEQDNAERCRLVGLAAEQLLAELQLKNEQLNRAIAESQQYAELWEWVANDNERQKKVLEETVNALDKANKQLAESQVQFLQSEMMSAVGRLAGGVAHEMNNPLCFVRGNISMLAGYVKDMEKLHGMYRDLEASLESGSTEDAKTLLDAISEYKKDVEIDFIFADMHALIGESLSGLDRALSIVSNLKSFTHIDDTEASLIDVNLELDNTIDMLSSKMHEIQVLRKYSELPLLNGYPHHLNHAFMSILENAIYAIKEGGRNGELSIKTEIVDEEIVVKIMDNGCGIPEENLGKVFEPFFTTKPVGSGTGLGLALVYQAIEKHKGRIEVSSRPKEWTSFAIHLPLFQTTR